MMNLHLKATNFIANTLECNPSDIKNLLPLYGGLMNKSYTFLVADKKFVLRIPGAQSSLFVNREAEATCEQYAYEHNFDPLFIHQNEDGWKISHYLEGARHLSVENEEDMNRAFDVIRKLHTHKCPVDFKVDYIKDSKKYVQEVEDIARQTFDEYDEMYDKIKAIWTRFESRKFPLQFSHNDFLCRNILITNETVALIDWEFAGLSEPFSDFAAFHSEVTLNEDEFYKTIELYLGRTPTDYEVTHAHASTAIGGFHWAVWALTNNKHGADSKNLPQESWKKALLHVDKALEI